MIRNLRACLALLTILSLVSVSHASDLFGLGREASGGPDRGPFPSEWVAGAPGAPGLTDPHVRAAWGLLEKELDPCEYADPEPRAGRVTGAGTDVDAPGDAWLIVLVDFYFSPAEHRGAVPFDDPCRVDASRRQQGRAAVRVRGNGAGAEVVQVLPLGEYPWVRLGRGRAGR
jgi:hypothetical protein